MRSSRRWITLAVASLPLTALAAARGAAPLPDLVVVQVPASAAPRDLGRGSSLLDRYVDGARIVRVDPAGGEPILLTAGFTAACDPDVSFDGRTIVFAGRRDAESTWQIWRMNADGSGKVQLTSGPGRHLDPVHAGARFYLDDPRPTPQVVFASDGGGGGAFSLYATDPQGGSLNRLTFNPLDDLSPAVLPTGQVVYSSRQPWAGPDGPDDRVALLSVNIDGTDLMPFHGSHGAPLELEMPAVSPDGDRVYFVDSDPGRWLGGGDLSWVSWRRPLSSWGRLAGEGVGVGVFHSPTPLAGGGLLAAWRPSDPDSLFAVYRVDPVSGRRVERVFGQPGWHSIDPRPLVPRPPARGRSNWLKPGATTGVFYCLDCYRTGLDDDGDGLVAVRGSIEHVRVIEGPSRRVLGVAPVEPDGSFHVRVPAETPLTFQLLDGDYVAVRSQSAWTWVMGNENRGCIGCHEDPELSPPNRVVDAVRKSAVDLVLPPGRRRSVGFRDRIGPMLAARCATAACHGTGGASPVLGGDDPALPDSALRRIYRSLLASSPGGAGAWVVPGSARSSPLVRRLLEGASATAGDAPHDMLEDHDRILLIEWVDLGAAWSREPDDGGSGP